MKRCYKCKETKPVDQFYRNPARPDGLGTDCKKCRIAAEVARNGRLRAKVKALKNQPCMDCGGSFPPECMDYDHRDPSLKSFEIGRNRALTNWSRMEEELAKCDLICANCHRIRTQKQSDAGAFNKHRGKSA
jgi:hypothetical protein